MSSISPCQISSNPLLTPYILMTPVLQLLCPLLTSPILLTRISPQPLLTFLLIPITPYSLFFPSFLLTPTSHTLLLTTTFPHSVSPQTHFFAPPAGRVPPPPRQFAGRSPLAFSGERGWDTHAKKGSSSKLLLSIRNIVILRRAAGADGNGRSSLRRHQPASRLLRASAGGNRRARD